MRITQNTSGSPSCACAFLAAQNKNIWSKYFQKLFRIKEEEEEERQQQQQQQQQKQQPQKLRKESFFSNVKPQETDSRCKIIRLVENKELVTNLYSLTFLRNYFPATF